ncbi:MAG TPA: cysteine rich repeat-containing protein [Turneriella sp.]|nr:cysteine rich repeat-containing protein [Turneriella sp.]HNJ66588.1 cysteine rich repeat-containing protein [Turneriella sp.]HNL12171.1 cysteine rich repeat-containing protein [Turneriella sp.]HNL55784.1 cysteine rich repeat-containing protein [Turneriella sp.]HNN01709.1 cysteine rich repeat-containing protein [Turneriella sp.]
MKQYLFFVVAAIVSVTAISAKGECRTDREKFCANVIKGNHKGMWQCMKEHENELSEPCKNHIAEVREKSREIKKSCKADYKKLCKQVKAGEGRIIKCLKQNETQLSKDCKAALTAPAQVE